MGRPPPGSGATRKTSATGGGSHSDLLHCIRSTLSPSTGFAGITSTTGVGVTTFKKGGSAAVTDDGVVVVVV